MRILHLCAATNSVEFIEFLEKMFFLSNTQSLYLNSSFYQIVTWRVLHIDYLFLINMQHIFWHLYLQSIQTVYLKRWLLLFQYKL